MSRIHEGKIICSTTRRLISFLYIHKKTVTWHYVIIIRLQQTSYIQLRSHWKEKRYKQKRQVAILSRNCATTKQISWINSWCVLVHSKWKYFCFSCSFCIFINIVCTISPSKSVPISLKFYVCLLCLHNISSDICLLISLTR